MKRAFIIPCLLLIGIVVLASALSKKPHNFSPLECALCHFDEKNDPMSIKPDITHACSTCHSGKNDVQSHPTDVYPSFSLPEDMPLLEGKLTCVTCHFTHTYQETDILFAGKNYFLRRPVEGMAFCSSCHKINEKKHIVFENIHTSTYKVFDSTMPIDSISLTCIGCHDTYMPNPGEKLGAGLWKHFRKKINHPIGISYETISAQKPRSFLPADMLRDEIKLFAGKIGCGTCHSPYSDTKNQLVIDNTGSMLCLECHIDK